MEYTVLINSISMQNKRFWPTTKNHYFEVLVNHKAT